MISVLDQVIQPGRAVRQLQFTDDAELTSETANGARYALLDTNRGQLECDLGTMAIKDDGSAIKWLTPSGWSDFIF